MDLLSSVQNKHWVIGGVEQGFPFFWANTQEDYTVFPFKTKKGKQKMALVLDQDPQAADKITKPLEDEVYDSSEDLKAGLRKFYTPATPNAASKLIYTTKVLTKDVLPGVSREQALRERAEPANDAKNIFGFSCEPVLSKGIVIFRETTGGDNYESWPTFRSHTADEDGVVLINVREGANDTYKHLSKEKHNPRFAAVNSAVKTYVFRNHAGERTMNESSQQYTDYASAIDDELLNFKTAKDPAAVQNTLIRLGNIDKTSNAKLGGYRSRYVLPEEEYKKIKNEADKPWIYFYENSVSDLGSRENKDYGFYRLSYAKVYVTVRPYKILKWDDERGHFILTNDYWLDKHSESNVVNFDKIEDLTFYKGATDGLYYLTVADAQKGVPGQKVYTYKDGRCFYRVLWNSQVTVSPDGVETVINANTRRNNAYFINILGFKKIGLPWDPSDPDDPNLPKPTTPEEGDNPDDPDIERQNSYLKFSTTIYPWMTYRRTVTID